MQRYWLLTLLLTVVLATTECPAAGDAPVAAGKPAQRELRIGRPNQSLLADKAVAGKPAVQTVEMTVDFGDGVQIRFNALPWHEKMTVLDAVTAATAHPHGVKFIFRGAGAGALITQIGDQKNEGGGANSRNWLFSVGGKDSEVGAGAYVLQPGDVILWRFGVFDNNE